MICTRKVYKKLMLASQLHQVYVWGYWAPTLVLRTPSAHLSFSHCNLWAIKGYYLLLVNWSTSSQYEITFLLLLTWKLGLCSEERGAFHCSFIQYHCDDFLLWTVILKQLLQLSLVKLEIILNSRVILTNSGNEAEGNWMADFKWWV